nr:extracellular solute-binding protein [Lachnospiraceae bacterium]
RVDNQGNEIRPTQVEVFDWQSCRLADDRGYESDPYLFYFEAGSNTITFGGENEPMAIRKIALVPVEEKTTYAQYVASVSSKPNSANGFELKVQGEDAKLRSESSLYAKYDRSSPTTEPNSVTYTVLNYTGGDSWAKNGQWIEWEIEVPEDGLYNIMIKGRQNYSRGNVSNRRIYVDGVVPFEELEEVSFHYSNDWQCKTLGDDDGNAYDFYLTRGKHTIRVEATMGGLGYILSELEDSTFRLNQIYRRLLVYTGANPDVYRDYHIDKTYPEIMEAMELEYKRLYKVVDDMVEYSGQKAENIASAQTVAIQLERFCKKPQKITTEFITFKDNITAIGTACLNLSESKMDVDYLVVSSKDVNVKPDKSNFFMKAWHEVKSFVASFFVDYNSVGDVYADSDDDVVKVWILTGRDQGTILKAMIDDTFTPNTGIPVNVEIVAANALLNAVMAGRGPNIVLSVGADQPVNYALRGAAEDITQFDGWEDVLSHYSPSSYEQYGLDGHIYGVPETQTFNVMFYRKDVLEELELEVPQTWQEFIEMLPTIQGNNLSVGIPSAGGSSATTAGATAAGGDLSMYFTLLFQNGGDMYNKAGTKTTVNDEAGMKAFDDYLRYFNDYGFPVIYDFVTRFRSGEMPIGIAAYSTYNTLMVSAPEIRGLWDFTLIPGTERTDANGNTYIDRSDFITGSATMMIASDNEKIKQKGWEFMKWWAQSDTQIRFGREIEALLGSSARYATANRDAFSSLSWSSSDIKTLNDQWDWTVGIREVPGGYFTGRHITNACRKVINDKDDTRETIIDYSILIDEEIVKKRKEFGMPIDIE